MKHNLLRFGFIALSLALIESVNAQCPAPTASGATINCGTSTTLTASSSSNYEWYDQSVAGNLLGTGATYTTPTLLTSTSYYVQGNSTTAPALMGMSPHASVFTGNTRGYYFTAPVDFTITGLKLPVEVSGLQNIAVVKLTAVPPLYATTTNAFTTLFLTQNNSSTGIIPVSIPVTTGDIIGILGSAGTSNSYGAGNYATTIGGQPVTIARLGMQYTLNTTAPQNLWTESAGSISRVEMYYTTGCTSPRTQVNVSVTPIPVTASASSTQFCAGNSTTLSASGATSFNWMPGNVSGSTYMDTPASTTTYTVTGTDPNGCSATAQITITVDQPPPVAVSASNASVCIGSSSTLTVTGASTYSWSSGGTGTSETVSPTSATTYTVTGTDANGCVNTATITVNVNALPTVTASAANGTICEGSPETLIASGASSYSWSSGGTNATEIVTPVTNSTYTVTGTDANGCENTAMVTVNVNPAPVVSLGADITQCGGSVTLDAQNAGATYNWSSGGSSQTENISASATVTVTVTDVNGCSGSDDIAIVINPVPSVNLGPDISACDSVSALLDAQNAGASYMWSTSATTQTIPVNTAGTYYVDVTNSDGCTTRDSIMLSINASPVVALGADMTVCGGPAILDAQNAGSSYMWSDLSVTQTISVPASGIFYVTVTDANGCMGSDTIGVTINPLPDVTATANPTTLCLDDANVALSAVPVGGSWSGPGVTGTTFSPMTAGNGTQSVIYTFTDANGCTGADTLVFTVNACTGAGENPAVENFVLYPNPNAGTFSVVASNAVTEMVIVITDMEGRVVFTSTDRGIAAGFVKQISLESESAGIYFMQISTDGNSAVKKICVQK
jgi:hypothetical protein